MNYNFENKVAFVTGAGSGIGESTAKLFAQAGAGIALVDIHPEPIQRLADELNGKGYKAFAISCNVGKEEEVKKRRWKCSGGWTSHSTMQGFKSRRQRRQRLNRTISNEPCA